MNARIHIRVARSGRAKNGVRVDATARPNYRPLEDSTGHPLPTAMFALDLDVPEEALRRAEQVAASVALDAAAGQVIVEQVEAPEAS